MSSSFNAFAVAGTAAIALALALPAHAVPSVPWVLETPELTPVSNPFGSGTISPDGDDPAVWLHPTDASKSLVITSVKNGGLRVYDLSANQVQGVLDPPASIGGTTVPSRLNNVDVQYGFKRFDGTRVDVAVLTDRGQDRLRVFAITGPLGAPLQEIQLAPGSAQRLFPDSKSGVSTPNPIGDQATGYGLALWRDPATDRLFALVTQRREASVAQFEITDSPTGFVATKVNQWNFPTTFTGSNGVTQALASGSPRQFEGMVVDRRTGILYAGQEDVGIWRVDLRTGIADTKPILESKTFSTTSVLTADIEGLTIRYGANGDAVLIVSSQGDSTFATYRISDRAYLGSFVIGDISIASGPNSGVNNSDGADVTSFALPGFPNGLFVTHDGANGLNGNGTPREVTNFKYVDWGFIAGPDASPELQSFLALPAGFDPRAIPEPGSLALLGAGLVAMLGLRRRPG